MSIYRIYAGADGESHIEEIHVAQHPELGALRQVAQVGIHAFPALRTMDFHPLPERRLIIHSRPEPGDPSGGGAERLTVGGYPSPALGVPL